MALDSTNNENGSHDRLRELLSIDIDDVVVNDVLKKITERRRRARQIAHRRKAVKKSTAQDVQPLADSLTKHASQTIDPKKIILPEVTESSSAQVASKIAPEPLLVESTPPTMTPTQNSPVGSKPERSDSPPKSRQSAFSSTQRMRRFLRTMKPTQQTSIRRWQQREEMPDLPPESTQTGDACLEEPNSEQIGIQCDDSTPASDESGKCETNEAKVVDEGTLLADVFSDEDMGAKDDASESKETQDSYESQETPVPKHLRGLFSSRALESKLKGRYKAEQQQPLIPEMDPALVSELFQNYLCGACTAHPFDEDSPVDVENVDVPAEIEVDNQVVKHFLKTRAEKFRASTQHEKAIANIRLETGPLAQHSSPPRLSRGYANASLSIDDQISQEPVTQKIGGVGQVSADSLSSQIQRERDDSIMARTEVKRVFSGDRDVNHVARHVMQDAATEPAGESLQEAAAREPRSVAKESSSPVRKVTATASRRPEASAAPLSTQSSFEQGQRKRPALPSPQQSTPSSAKQLEHNEGPVVKLKMSPLRKLRQAGGTFRPRDFEHTNILRQPHSPTSVQSTRFLSDASNQSIECWAAFDKSELKIVGMDNDLDDIASDSTSVETFSLHSLSNFEDDAVDTPMPTNCATPENEDLPTLAQNLELPLSTGMAAFADFFNFQKSAPSPQKVERSSLARLFFPTSAQDVAISHSSDSEGPSRDDDGPSIEDDRQSYDDDVPSLDEGCSLDDVPSLDEGYSLDDGHSLDDGSSLDDGPPHEEEWTRSMSEGVDKVVEALDATTSGIFPRTTDIGDMWLTKVVLNPFRSSKHATVDDLIEDVCDKLDDIETSMFFSGFWSATPDAHAHETRLTTAASF